MAPAQDRLHKSFEPDRRHWPLGSGGSTKVSALPTQGSFLEVGSLGVLVKNLASTKGKNTVSHVREFPTALPLPRASRSKVTPQIGKSLPGQRTGMFWVKTSIIFAPFLFLQPVSCVESVGRNTPVSVGFEGSATFAERGTAKRCVRRLHKMYSFRNGGGAPESLRSEWHTTE